MQSPIKSLILASILATCALSQSCSPDLLLDDFTRRITNNRNLQNGEYGDSYAPYSFTSGSAGQVTVTAGTPPTGDNYWFFKNDAEECFDLRPYSHIQFDLTAPTGSDSLITLTQKLGDCVTRGADSVYLPLSQFTSPNGSKQTVRIPLSVFARNVEGGFYDFQHLKDITFVAMKPSGAKFVFDNIIMIGDCTTAPPANDLSDWSRCSTSSECESSCCSDEYSEGKILKCHPAGTSSLCVGGLTGDWDRCETSSECSSSCCSGEFSEGGILKCHPAGSSSLCVGGLKDDWNRCEESSECSSSCCSGEFSAGGILKCHPAGSSQLCT